MQWPAVRDSHRSRPELESHNMRILDLPTGASMQLDFDLTSKPSINPIAHGHRTASLYKTWNVHPSVYLEILKYADGGGRIQGGAGVVDGRSRTERRAEARRRLKAGGVSLREGLAESHEWYLENVVEQMVHAKDMLESCAHHLLLWTLCCRFLSC
ncbi:hypothetical protein GW17_00052237 [Ensete ventricosum]|nr:hypothetical protein GW17_00052237 [Ensete ventricosum]